MRLRIRLVVSLGDGYKGDMTDEQQQANSNDDEQPLQSPGEAPAPVPAGGQIPGAEKKIVAGILGIVLGTFGVHKFILGYQQEGIIMAAIGAGCIIGNLIPFVGCITVFGSMAIGVIGLIEGIIYLTKTDEEFVNTYITNKKTWF